MVDFDRLGLFPVRNNLVQSLLNPGEPLHYSLIFGDLRVGADNERQRVLHLAKGRDYLHQAAELDGFREISRSCHHEREDDRELSITGGEPGQLLATPDNSPPIPYNPLEADLKCVEFARLTTIEGDVLCVLAEPDHAEAKIGLVALLIKVKLNQGITDPASEHRPAHGIDKRGKDHGTRDMDRGAASQWNHRGTRQGPQDRQKRDESYEGAQQPKRQSQG